MDAVGSRPRTWTISTRRLRARFSGSTPARTAARTSRRPSSSMRARDVDRLLEHAHHAHRALARELEVVLEAQRADRLIVGVPDDEHAPGHLVRAPRRRGGWCRRARVHSSALPDANRSRASRVTTVRPPCSSALSTPALLLGREQLLQRRARRRRRPARRNRRARSCESSAWTGAADARQARVVEGEGHGQHRPAPRRRPPTRARSGSAGFRRSSSPATAATARRRGAPRWLRICRYSVCWTAASCSWPRSITWYFPANPSARQRYCSSIRSMCFEAFVRHPPEHLEELLAAPGLAMQRHEQRVLRPLALRRPMAWRARPRRAPRTGRSAPRWRCRWRRPAARARSSKRSNLVERVAPQPRDVHRRHRAPQPAGQQQQRARRAHQRVQADAEQLARLGRQRVDLGERLAPATAAARQRAPRRPAPGPRPKHRGLRALEWIVDVGHDAGLVQLRMAQNSMREPGKVARDVQGDAARGPQLAPQLAVLIQFEVGEAGVKRNLARRDRQRRDGNARQLQRDQVADLSRPARS